MSNAIRFTKGETGNEDEGADNKEIFIKALPNNVKGDDSVDNNIHLPNDKLGYKNNETLTKAKKNQ